jgi:TRAP-type mannitol/chloroaromatic compound transport system substrate-binding protein
MLAKYDNGNPAALRRLVAAGAQVRIYSREVLNALFDATEKLYAELGAQNPQFKKVYESWNAYRQEELFWWRVNELSFDTFSAARFGR